MWYLVYLPRTRKTCPSCLKWKICIIVTELWRFMVIVKLLLVLMYLFRYPQSVFQSNKVLFLEVPSLLLQGESQMFFIKTHFDQSVVKRNYSYHHNLLYFVLPCLFFVCFGVFFSFQLNLPSPCMFPKSLPFPSKPMIETWVMIGRMGRGQPTLCSTECSNKKQTQEERNGEYLWMSSLSVKLITIAGVVLLTRV